ncbi:hypothetical protein CsSME_00010150 [Camellia sinensis var. sinensis]
MALSSHSHTILTTTPSSSSHSLPKLLHLPQHHSLSFPIKPTTTQYTQNLSTTTTSPVSDKWRTHVSFFPAFLNKTRDAKPIKEELLEAIAPLDRGADATPEDQQRIDQIARKLEAVNPTKEPLKSDLLNGKWELIYTTSKSILQTQKMLVELVKDDQYSNRPKLLRSRTNYQAINVDTLRAQNMESWPFFNQVTADLTPLNARKVAVKFDFFKIGGVPIDIITELKRSNHARGDYFRPYKDFLKIGWRSHINLLKKISMEKCILDIKLMKGSRMRCCKEDKETYRSKLGDMGKSGTKILARNLRETFGHQAKLCNSQLRHQRGRHLSLHSCYPFGILKGLRYRSRNGLRLKLAKKRMVRRGNPVIGKILGNRMISNSNNSNDLEDVDPDVGYDEKVEEKPNE